MISNRCTYALEAMLELAVQEGSGPIPISQVAAQHGIPARFLEAILRQLKQAGLTDSARGKDGGYFLAKPARTITAGEVIRLFEGSLVSLGCASGDGSPGGTATAPVLMDLSKQAEAALSKVYDSATFGELADRERMRRSGGIANYSI
jgi:Rrf2 family protein